MSGFDINQVTISGQPHPRARAAHPDRHPAGLQHAHRAQRARQGRQRRLDGPHVVLRRHDLGRPRRVDRQERHQGREGRRRRPAALARVGRRRATSARPSTSPPTASSPSARSAAKPTATAPTAASPSRPRRVTAPAARPTGGPRAPPARNGDDTTSSATSQRRPAGPRNARHRALPAALFGREDRRAYIEVRYRHRDTMRRHFLRAHRHLRRGAHDRAPGPEQRRLRRRRASAATTTPAARTPSTASGRCGPTSTPPTRTTRFARRRSRRRSSSHRGPPGTCTPTGRSRGPSASPRRRPRTAGSPRARRRRRRGHERRDDPQTARHLLLQDHASDTGRARARLDAALTTLEAATDASIADEQPPPTPHDARRRDRHHRPGSDPLRALDPAHYVSVLTGQTVGRSRKISCPFHDDRTPSLHVYEHPEDGWYCFGCKRHGHTVYDLASALWGLRHRGGELHRAARPPLRPVPARTAPPTARAPALSCTGPSLRSPHDAADRAAITCSRSGGRVRLRGRWPRQAAPSARGMSPIPDRAQGRRTTGSGEIGRAAAPLGHACSSAATTRPSPHRRTRRAPPPKGSSR